MHAMHLFALVAALGFMTAPYAQTRDERATEPQRKKTTPLSQQDTIRPKPHQPKPSQPQSTQPRSAAPHADRQHHAPHRTRIEREREYEPRPRPRASTPERTAPPAAQTQQTRTTARPPERDAALARCDELRRRMERAMRNESRTVDERRAIYQEQLRAGCI